MTLLLPNSFGSLQDLDPLSVVQQNMSTLMALRMKEQRSFGEVNFVVLIHVFASIATVLFSPVALSPNIVDSDQVRDNSLVSTVRIMNILAQAPPHLLFCI